MRAVITTSLANFFLIFFEKFLGGPRDTEIFIFHARFLNEIARGKLTEDRRDPGPLVDVKHLDPPITNMQIRICGNGQILATIYFDFWPKYMLLCRNSTFITHFSPNAIVFISNFHIMHKGIDV